uniref:RNA binding motif protein 12Bb n=1 Tax=Callorhinchus milii TaxID=7868 RepID=A0A4W3ITF6_CALMI
MAVVIRLQGLPVSAGTLDIRHFFSRLTVPDGGVHIIGGEVGEAFIVFATDEDARLALMRSGETLKGNRTKLTLSSRSEMQNTIEMSRKRYTHSSEEMRSARRSGSSSSGTDRLSSMPPALAANLVAAMQHGMNRVGFNSSNVGGSCINYSSRMDPMMSGNMSAMSSLSSSHNVPVSSMTTYSEMSSRSMNNSLNKFNGSGSMGPSTNSIHGQTGEQGPDDIYLRLYGMPYSAKELQIREFFHNLQVEGIRQMKDYRGRKTGEAYVRFATSWDASEGLKCHRKYMGQRFVEVYPATEEQWNCARVSLDVEDRNSDVIRGNRGYSPHELKYSHTLSRSPRRCRSRTRSPHDAEYCVQLKNIPYGAEKKDVRHFFHELDISEDQIYLVHDSYGKSTKEGFVVFKNSSDYRRALKYHKECIGNRAIYVYPIARRAMVDLIDTVKRQKSRERPVCKLEDKRYEPKQEPHCFSRLYIYLRNLPFDISKSEICKFFEGFFVADDWISIIVDSKGIGLGEALVKFKYEDDALRAARLQGKKIAGREAFLKLITSEQVLDLGVGCAPERSKGQKDYYFGCGGSDGDHSLPFDVHELAESPFEIYGGLGSGTSMQRSRCGQEEGYYREFETGNSNFGGSTGCRYGSGFDSGYQDAVTIRFNDNGLPAGDAVIAFETVDEAMAAVQDLNEKPIGKRKVKLSML